MSSRDREISHLRPLPRNVTPLRPQYEFQINGALALSPQPIIEKPKLEIVQTTYEEKPHFKSLSPSKKRKLRRGVMLGFVPESTLETRDGLRKVDSDSSAAEHETNHWAALVGLASSGYDVTPTSMSVKPSSEYRAVTHFAINPSIPLEQRAWIILVAAMGSAAPDNLGYGYTHAGRGGDEGQANEAANIISIVKYQRRVSPSSIKQEAREIATEYVKEFKDESLLWKLTRDEAA